MSTSCSAPRRGPWLQLARGPAWTLALCLFTLACARGQGVYLDLLEDDWNARVVTTRALEDFGVGFSSTALLDGWGDPETDDVTGEDIRWATARRAEVAVWLLPGPDDYLTIRAWPFHWEGAPEQKVSVRINDTLAGTLALQPGRRTYSLALPVERISPGRNTLTFEFSRLGTPNAIEPGAIDQRPLAAAFAWLEVSQRRYGPEVERPDGLPDMTLSHFPWGYSLLPGRGLAGEVKIPRRAPSARMACFNGSATAIALDLWVKANGSEKRLPGPRVRAGERREASFDLGFAAGSRAELVIVPRVIANPDGPDTGSGPEERVVVDLLHTHGDLALVRDHTVLDFEPEDVGALLSGWAVPERPTNSAESFAWAIAERAEVSLQMVPAGSQWLSFRAWPLTWPGAPSQLVKIKVNDSLIGQAALASGATTIELPLPGGSIHAGENRITFEFSRATVPAEVLPGSSDRRRLAAAFEWIEVAPFPAVKDARRPRLIPSAAVERTSFGYLLPPGVGFVLPVERTWGEARARFHVAPGRESQAQVSVYARRSGSQQPVLVAQCIAHSLATPCDADLGDLAEAGGEAIIHAGRDSRSLAANTATALLQPRIVARAQKPVVLGIDKLALWGGADFRGDGSNLLLIVADTLRADHLGCYGGQVATPNIDRLAESGMVFTNVYAPSPITGPSHAAMFTSLHPRHAGVTNNTHRLADTYETLAEHLNRKGFATAAFVSLGVLARQFGFAQGFEVFDDTFGADWMRNAQEINRAAGAWVREQERGPFFLWLHYSDPHEPYAPPDLAYPQVELAVGAERAGVIPANGRGHWLEVVVPPGQTSIEARVATRGQPFPLLLHSLASSSSEVVAVPSPHCDVDGVKTYFPLSSYGAFTPIVTLENRTAKTVPVTLSVAFAEDLPAGEIRARYAAEVEYMDGNIGRMLALLKARGMLHNTVVVFVGDHGESLGEHEHVGHISRLYEPALRVPLIIVKPGKKITRRVVTAPVSLVDVTPTILDLLGLPAAQPTQGLSLLAASSEELSRRPVWAETFPPESPWRRQAVLFDGWKLIRTMESEPPVDELFDLRADPGELHNLATSHPERAAMLLALLNRLEDRPKNAPEVTPASPRLSDEERARLRSLGYLR